jgi:hypothetical protein
MHADVGVAVTAGGLEGSPSSHDSRRDDEVPGSSSGALLIRTADGGDGESLSGLDVTANSPVSADTSHTFRPSAVDRRKQIMKCKMLRWVLVWITIVSVAGGLVKGGVHGLWPRLALPRAAPPPRPTNPTPCSSGAPSPPPPG